MSSLDRQELSLSAMLVYASLPVAFLHLFIPSPLCVDPFVLMGSIPSPSSPQVNTHLSAYTACLVYLIAHVPRRPLTLVNNKAGTVL